MQTGNTPAGVPRPPGALAQQARVETVSDLGAGYAIVAMSVERALAARPGQFVMVRGDWGSAPLLSRPMSLLVGGTRPEILIKVVGEGTRRLAQARPGEPLDVLGPLGTAYEDPPAGARVVLVAGGVGVAPLWFLCEQWSARGRPRPVFLYGGRTARDLPGSDRIASVADLEVTTEDGSRGMVGRVTVALAPLLNSAASVPTVVYTCGPNRMMAAVARLAQEVGAPCIASLEAPMACGYGVCLGCAVPRTGGGYHTICVEGPVIDAARVAWEGDG
jgi:dihydroorotate dehydrogenase electron transfer subunit